MAESFQFSESNTSEETVHDNIANLNFGSNDSYEIVPATYKITKGQNSFSKYIRAKFGGTFTEISNMKFWKSVGAYKTEELVKADSNKTFGTPSQTGTGDATIPTEVGSALHIHSAGGTDTIVAPGYSMYIRLQLQTTTNTEIGVVNQKTFCFQYDAA